MKYLISFFIIVFFTGCTPQIEQMTIDLAKKIDNLNEKRTLDDNTNYVYKKNEIYLRANKKWHNGLVNQVLITNDKQKMISISRGKEILITNLKTGELEDKILGEIALSDFGKVQAIALSPNNKYLAIGGKFAYKTDTYTSIAKVSEEERLYSGGVRIYDLKLKKQKTLLLTSTSFVEHLHISQDGKYLISSSLNGSIRIWDMKNYKLLHRFNRVGITDMTTHKNRLFLASSSGKIMSFNLKNAEPISSKSIASYISSIALGKNEIAIGTSENKSSLSIYSLDLNFLTSINLNRAVESLDYSLDGRYIVVGMNPEKYSNMTYDGVKIFDRKNDNKLISHYTKNDDTVGAVKFIDRNLVLTTGGSDGTPAYIWDFKTNKTIKLIKGYSRYLSLGVKGEKIAFGEEYYKNYENRKDKMNNRGPFKNSFDLEKMQISEDIQGFERLKRIDKNRKLELERLGSRLQVAYYKNGDKESSIPVGLTSGHINMRAAVGFHKDYILSAGITPKIYNLEFEEIAQLRGHESQIWSIKGYKDYIVTAGSDRMIHFWDTRALNKNQFKVLSPSLSLFIDDKNEWVFWTKEGYFNASENGYSLIGFHLNQGHDKEAKWIGIEKLYDHFYRPDLVKLALKGEDINKYTKGLSYKDVLKNSPPKVSILNKSKTTKSNKINMKFKVNQVDNGGVGLIRIYQEGKLIRTIGNGKVSRKAANVIEEIETEKLEEKAKTEQSKYLENIDLIASKSIEGTVNEKELVQEVPLNKTSNKEGIFDLELPLKAGRNTLEIEAFNKTNTVASIREKIQINAKIKKRKPTVYAIVAGVNEFEQNRRFKNLKYSQNDAKAIKKALETKIKEKVEVTYLIGKDLTKENLLKAVEKIKKKAKLEDKVIFYISTHGKAIKGNLYLIPQNNKQARSWIKFEELFKEIQSINALEQIFVVDACESGKAKDIVAAIYDSKASVLAKSSGVHVLLATTKGTYAFEHSNPNVKHGVFTNNILKALNDKSTDKNRDRKISVIELSKTLKESKYTVKHQYPVIRNVGYDTKIRDLK